MCRLLDLGRVVLVSVVVAIAVLATNVHAEPQRVALVIGNGAYRGVPTLPNPANDARDIATALSRLGFAVTRIENAGFDAMRRALLEFGRQSRGAEMALVFYAGHGMEVSGENWLIPVDAELKSDTDVEHEAIGLRNVMGTVDGAARLGLVILDACRNNPFDAKMRRTIRTRAVSRGLVQVEPSGNVLVAYAARDGTTAADGDGRNSPFTAALLRNIETPGLEINFLFRNVRDDVMTATNRDQQPWVYGSLSREAIYLNPAAAGSMPDAKPQTTVPARPVTPAQPEFAGRPNLARSEPGRPPRPRAPGEKCATLKGQTGTDFYCASSVLAPQFGNSYGVGNLFSNALSDAWVEGRPGQGIGEWVTIEFEELRLIKAVIVRNGYQKDLGIFRKNNRVRRLRLVFSHGETQMLTLLDRMGIQTFALERPVQAYWVQFIIDDVYPGSTYNDTALSKLFLTADRVQ